MRLTSSVLVLSVLTSVFFSAQAWAQDAKKQKGKAEGEATAGGSLDTGADPSETETGGDGRLTSHGKTGKLKKEEEDKKEAKAATTTKSDADSGAVLASARKKIQAFAEIGIGFGAAPAPIDLTGAGGIDEGSGDKADPSTLDATTFAFSVGGGYDLTPDITLGLIVPFTLANIQENTAVAHTPFALGTPELLGEYRLHLSKKSTLAPALGIGIPIASGNPDPSSTDGPRVLEWEANLLGDATHGWRDAELYAVKRLPLVPQVSFLYRSGSIDLKAGLKLALMIKTGGEFIDPATSGTGTLVRSGLAVRGVLPVGILWRFLASPKLAVGLDTWLAHDTVPGVDFDYDGDDTGPAKLQWVLAPRLEAEFGVVRPSISYLAPVGGRLGNAGSKGLFLRADFGF